MKYRRLDGEFLAGSDLRGFVRVPLNSLVEHFGEPDYVNEWCPAEWVVEFEDGTQASIYVHKPLEHGLKDGEVPTREFPWHVGGFEHAAVYHVAEVLGVTAETFGPDIRYDPSDIPF